jgi:hypothetical protein
MPTYNTLLLIASLLCTAHITARGEESIVFHIRCYTTTTSELHQLEQLVDPTEKEYRDVSATNSYDNVDVMNRIQELSQQMNDQKQRFFGAHHPIHSESFQAIPGVPFDISIPLHGEKLRFRGVTGRTRANTGETIYDYPDRSNLWTSVAHEITYGNTYRTTTHNGALRENHYMFHRVEQSSTQQLWVVINAVMKK